MSKASIFRDKTIPELEGALVDLNQEIYALVNEVKRSKKVEKPHLIHQKKKEKARLLTVLHEKQSLALQE